MNILLDYFEKYLEETEVDAYDLQEYDEAIRETKSPKIRRIIERERQNAEEELRQMYANDLWCNDSNDLREMTYHISAPITKRTRQMWNGTDTVEEDTEEERTLSEWIDQIMSAGSFDDYRVYTEDGEVLMDFVHHDGTNHYRFGHHLAGEIEKALDY